MKIFSVDVSEESYNALMNLCCSDINAVSSIVSSLIDRYCADQRVKIKRGEEGSYKSQNNPAKLSFIRHLQVCFYKYGGFMTFYHNVLQNNLFSVYIIFNQRNKGVSPNFKLSGSMVSKFEADAKRKGLIPVIAIYVIDTSTGSASYAVFRLCDVRFIPRGTNRSFKLPVYRADDDGTLWYNCKCLESVKTLGQFLPCDLYRAIISL